MKGLMKLLLVIVLLVSAGGAGWYWLETQKYPRPAWSDKELQAIESLWLGSLPGLPEDPSNRFADNPDAAALGHRIFFDTRFSGNGEVACATCHQPDKYFTDGLALAVGMGVTGRSSPSIVGTAYHPFIFWDGRADSQWVQALGPMESAVEHGGSLTQYAHLVASDSELKTAYEALFGPLPDLSDTERFPVGAGPVDAQAQPDTVAAWEAMSEGDRATVTGIYVNIGKVIAAYERLIMPAASRFDAYAKSLVDDKQPEYTLLTRDEVEGLRLFIGDGRCLECHNGPLFSNDGFQNIGTPLVEGKPFDFGRSIGVNKVINAEFNCLSRYSDAEPAECGELRFIKRVGDDLAGSFKVPGLRNVTATAPYMHAGQLEDLEAVMDHYSKAPVPAFGHSMLTRLDLDEQQINQLIAFLHTLDSGIAADSRWLSPPVTDGEPTNQKTGKQDE